MNKLHLAILVNLASILAFFQLQGHYVWKQPWLKINMVCLLYKFDNCILYIGILLNGRLNTLEHFGI